MPCMSSCLSKHNESSRIFASTWNDHPVPFFSHISISCRSFFYLQLNSWQAKMTRRTSLAISLIFGGGHVANAFVPPSPSLLSTSGAGHSTHASTTGGRIAGTGSVATHAAASTSATTRRREDTYLSTCIRSRQQQRQQQSNNGPLHMFVGFQDYRAPRNHEQGRLPGNDPY